MIKILEKYQIFAYLILIILILTVIKIKYRVKPGDIQPAQVIPEITQAMSPTPTINKDYPLLDKLPYQGKGFVVEKYVAPMTLNLIIDTATEQQAAKDISIWLDAFGELGSGHIVELEEASPTSKLKINN